MLIDAHKNPYADKERQAAYIKHLTWWFQKALTEKASQESVQQVRNYDRCPSEKTSPSPADNPGPRVSVWHILKQQVTGW